MIRRIAKWHGFNQNEAFLVAKSALGPHRANPPHIHMTQAKSANFFKITVFHETRVGPGVDGPDKAAGYLQNSPRTRVALVASGPQSAL